MFTQILWALGLLSFRAILGGDKKTAAFWVCLLQKYRLRCRCSPYNHRESPNDDDIHFSLLWSWWSEGG